MPLSEFQRDRILRLARLFELVDQSGSLRDLKQKLSSCATESLFSVAKKIGVVLFVLLRVKKVSLHGSNNRIKERRVNRRDECGCFPRDQRTQFNFLSFRIRPDSLRSSFGGGRYRIPG